MRSLNDIGSVIYIMKVGWMKSIVNIYVCIINKKYMYSMNIILLRLFLQKRKLCGVF